MTLAVHACIPECSTGCFIVLDEVNDSPILFTQHLCVQTLGIVNSKDRELLKKKIKELKAAAEKEKKEKEKEQKLQEKERKAREKEQKKLQQKKK